MKRSNSLTRGRGRLRRGGGGGAHLAERDGVEDVEELLLEALVEEAVEDGVDAGGGHAQQVAPDERQQHQLQVVLGGGNKYIAFTIQFESIYSYKGVFIYYSVLVLHQVLPLFWWGRVHSKSTFSAPDKSVPKPERREQNYIFIAASGFAKA